LIKLEFNTLKTDLFVHEDKVYIPQTDVESSALDMSFAAMYNVANEDYQAHLEMHLKDVLMGKSKKLLETTGRNEQERRGYA
jgi:purine-nucleoside phosphorylase